MPLLLLPCGHHSRAGSPDSVGVLERAVQHGGAHVEEGLHRHSVPAHLLRLGHALDHDRIDRALHECRRDRLSAPTPGRTYCFGARWIDLFVAP